MGKIKEYKETKDWFSYILQLLSASNSTLHLWVLGSCEIFLHSCSHVDLLLFFFTDYRFHEKKSYYCQLTERVSLASLENTVM